MGHALARTSPGAPIAITIAGGSTSHQPLESDCTSPGRAAREGRATRACSWSTSPAKTLAPSTTAGTTLSGSENSSRMNAGCVAAACPRPAGNLISAPIR